MGDKLYYKRFKCKRCGLIFEQRIDPHELFENIYACNNCYCVELEQLDEWESSV